MAKDREIVALAPQSGHSPATAKLVLEQQAQSLVIFPLHCIIQGTFFPSYQIALILVYRPVWYGNESFIIENSYVHTDFLI